MIDAKLDPVHFTMALVESMPKVNHCVFFGTFLPFQKCHRLPWIALGRCACWTPNRTRQNGMPLCWSYGRNMMNILPGPQGRDIHWFALPIGDGMICMMIVMYTTCITQEPHGVWIPCSCFGVFGTSQVLPTWLKLHAKPAIPEPQTKFAVCGP